MDPAIFLDRDGTLVPDDANAGVPARLTLLDGVAPSLRRLRDAGFRLVVATNQGGVAHGRFTEREVDAFHTRLSELLDEQTGVERTIARFYYCPFHPTALIPEYTRQH
ncbi:MAG: HAD-IIIA family hydrolase, partial [Phycisphaerales bacterium]